MKKILVFGISNHLGGIESFFHNYFMNIDIKKYCFDFVAPEGAIAYQKDYEKYKSNIYSVPFYLKHPIKYISNINKILKNNNYDVVYVNMLSAANIIPLKIAKKYKIKTIIAHSHNADIPSNIVRKILHYINVKKIPKYANQLVSCSDKAGNFMFGKNKYVIINNAIDSSKFLYSKKIDSELRKKFNIKENEIVVGHIGRFCEQKNQEFIIAIAEKLKNVKFFLFGEGENKNSIKKEIEEKNLKNIYILDSVYDINKYYNVFDIFILPSKFEGLPVVGIEAQFNGIPCIFSNKITKQLKYNDNIIYLNIDNSKLWSKTINKDLKRTKPNFKLYEDFDINNQSKIFEQLLDLRDDKNE